MIKESELILNPDGSIYHINLRPEQVADTVILVGDPNRVPRVSAYFDNIEFSTQKREFCTHTGTYKGKRLTVISTGIGPDNIDIVINELDALANIDLHTRQGMDNMFHSYKDSPKIRELAMEEAFIAHTGWNPLKGRPYIIACGQELKKRLLTDRVFEGITGTAPGFYGPQGRVLRLPVQDPDLNDKLHSFNHNGHRMTNLEMETSAIYGLSKLLGHQAVSLNAIIANRPTGTFTKDTKKVVEDLIVYGLEQLAK